MERLLGSRWALVTAWSFVGLLALGAAGFALYLLWPTATARLDDEPELRPVAVASVPVPTLTGRLIFTGTVERVEGQALLVKVGDAEQTRVLVRSSAPVGLVTSTTANDIQRDEPVAVTVTRRSSDGKLEATRVRIQPTAVPAGTPASDTRATGFNDPFVLIGTVTGREPGRLHLRTARGEQTVELGGGVRVTRFRPIAFSELRAGQRVTIDGERLVDGSLAALSVQVFDQR